MSSAPDQLALVPAPRPRVQRKPASAEVLTGDEPVVEVMIDSPLPHLDRVFDYALPASAQHAVVGSRVRVRFAGRLTDGYVVGRSDAGRHARELRPVERVIGLDAVLTIETIALIAAVAERYAGTFSDVARAAVPPRHARAEAAAVAPSGWRAEADTDAADRWRAYDAGPALIDRLTAASASATRAVWSAAPANSWPADLAALVRAVLSAATGGVIVVVPDAADVDRVREHLTGAADAGAIATLTADQGAERRYREFLRVLRGGARLVIGTRGCVFAPMPDLRLIVVWDDGNDSLVDPQAPYWDARDVAALRSHLSGCDLVVGSPARSVATEQWCETGWAHSVTPSRATIAARGPIVRAMSEEDSARDGAAAAARIPHEAWRAARAALESGPVLVQVARRGYLPALSCQSCRELARCDCGGPLEIDAGSALPQCGWCGSLAAAWTCRHCDGTRLRAVAVGSERTAEEIGRAFPGVIVRASHAGHILRRVPDEPAIVVATPGAEPDCDRGYRAVLLLDGRAQLQRQGLDASEDAVRRWFVAAGLAAPGARVLLTADNSRREAQALLRWDPAWYAERELAERASAGLPPAVRMAELRGASADLLEVSAALAVPHRLLGPVPSGREGTERQRAFVTVPREHAMQLARELRAIVATRSASARERPVHVRMDPRDV